MSITPKIPQSIIDLITDQLAKGAVELEREALDPELAKILNEFFEKSVEYSSKADGQGRL